MEGCALVGAEPPLLGDGSVAPPDHREVSVRYLAGTFLTGVIALGLMGGALWGAAEGRTSLTARAHAMPTVTSRKIAARTPRLARPKPTAVPTDRAIISVPMLVPSASGGSEVRSKPFAHLTLALDAGHRSDRPTPRFDPASMFRASETEKTAPTGAIYGAHVETQIRLTHRPLPLDSAPRAPSLDANVIQARVDDALSPEGLQTNSLPTGAVVAMQDAIASLILPATVAAAPAGRAKVLERNVSVAKANLIEPEIDERVVYVDRDVSSTLAAFAPDDADRFASALNALEAMAAGKAEGTKPAGKALRVAFARDVDGSERIVRAGLYDGADFRAAVAIDDTGRLGPASMPSGPGPAPRAEPDKPRPKVLNRSLHDALHQTSYAYGLPDALVSRIAELVSSKSDFRANVRADDRIEVLLALPEGATEADANAQLIYLSGSIGTERVTLYRHVAVDGTVGWYDEQGRGARPFLLRKPLATGRFRSPYGMRRHPIRKRMRMHWGVDWSAPGGTPIYAAADGVVKEARWAGGNGRRVILVHPNGYESSYSHQRRFAKGIRPGARVKQGQVIGYVGTTGLSTGNHLHYELKVNGQRVDPMRVRLPASASLGGTELARFQDAKLRVDELLARRRGEQLVAQR